MLLGPDQLRSNLAALTVVLDPAAFTGLAVEPGRYWSERGALAWS